MSAKIGMFSILSIDMMSLRSERIRHIAMVLPKATPPEKITISSDVDGALGYVLRVARQRPYAITAEELRAEICVGLGGMEAERMVCGDISIGAYGDLQRCTQTAAGSSAA